MPIYDSQRESILEIDELHVLAGKGDQHNFYTVNKASNMPKGNHSCKNELYNSNGYANSPRHYYDIPYKLRYVINLYYRVQRFVCLSCNHKFALPTAFADEKSKQRYTYRFEKWIAQQCLVKPFSAVSEDVMGITPSVLIKRNKDAEKIVSESGVKNLFRRWIERQDAQFLKDMAPIWLIGIHKSRIRNKEIYLFTYIMPENNHPGTVVWLADNLHHLQTTLKEVYSHDCIDFPKRILVDWDPSRELITFSQKLFPNAEIVIDFKRIPRYMRECIDISKDAMSSSDLEYLEGEIKKYEDYLADPFLDETSIWSMLKNRLYPDVFLPLWKDAGNIKNSLWPKRIETDGEYWNYVDDIQSILQYNDYGCSVEALRARILYQERRPYDEEVNKYRLKKMTADKAMYYLMDISLYDEKHVFPRFSRKIFTNTPSDPFINCLYYGSRHENYGVPFKTALANLRSTELYHEAYDYYLAHMEEVERLLAEWEEDEPFDEESNDT